MVNKINKIIKDITLFGFNEKIDKFLLNIDNYDDLKPTHIIFNVTYNNRSDNSIIEYEDKYEIIEDQKGSYIVLDQKLLEILNQEFNNKLYIVTKDKEHYESDIILNSVAPINDMSININKSIVLTSIKLNDIDIKNINIENSILIKSFQVKNSRIKNTYNSKDTLYFDNIKLENVLIETDMILDSSSMNKSISFSNVTIENNLKIFKSYIYKIDFQILIIKSLLDLIDSVIEAELYIYKSKIRKLLSVNIIYKKDINIENTTYEDKVIFDKNIFSKINFSNTTFENVLYFIDCDFTKKSVFKVVTFFDMQIEGSKFHADSVFFSVTFEKRILLIKSETSKVYFNNNIYFNDSLFKEGADFRDLEVKGILTFNNSLINKTIFLVINEDNIISKLDLEKSVIDTLIFNKNNIKEYVNVDTLRIIKDKAIKQNDRVLAWDFHAKEMNKRTKTTNKYDVVMWYNKITNNHGLSILLPTAWIISVILLISFVEYFFGDGIDQHIYMNYFNPLNEVEDTGSVNMFIFRLIVEYLLLVPLIWQLIRSIRKYSNMP